MARTTEKNVNIADLVPCDYNPRLITDDQFRRLQASIREHTNTLAGWSSSDGLRMATTITVNRNGHRIVGGAQRVRALAAMGQDWIHPDDITWVDIVPESALEKSLNVSLNNREAQGAFDGAKLDALLGDLAADAPDLFDGLELGMIDIPDGSGGDHPAGPVPGRTDPDAIPPPATPAVSRAGDVYAFGGHRLVCADATRADTLDRLMDGQAADILLTDPPYGVAYQSRGQADRPIANDDLDPAALRRFLSAALRNAAPRLAPGAAFYIWHADTMSVPTRMACADAGLDIRQCLVWVKNALILGRQDYQWRHEPCLYGWARGASHAWHGDRAQSTVLEFDKPARSDDHPTTKPVGLFERLLLNSCPRGGVVLDIFAGSGTAVLAAELHGAHARLVELEPAYCDVIRRRWAEFVHGPGCDWPALTPAAPSASSAS